MQEKVAEFPYKAQFLKRMKYSREWLDLMEVEIGMNKTLAEDNSEHQFIMIDAFDVEKDQKMRDEFFDKLIKQCSV